MYAIVRKVYESKDDTYHQALENDILVTRVLVKNSSRGENEKISTDMWLLFSLAAEEGRWRRRISFITYPGNSCTADKEEAGTGSSIHRRGNCPCSAAKPFSVGNSGPIFSLLSTGGAVLVKKRREREKEEEEEIEGIMVTGWCTKQEEVRTVCTGTCDDRVVDKVRERLYPPNHAERIVGIDEYMVTVGKKNCRKTRKKKKKKSKRTAHPK